MDKERQTPLRYLLLNDFKLMPNSYSRNWIFEKKVKDFKICGKIQNKAQHTIYKNIEIEVLFYSKKNEIIERQIFCLNQWFPPNQNNEVEIILKKYDQQNFNHFLTNIIKADIVEGTKRQKNEDLQKIKE